ncbi:glycosyltransferase, partial [Halanaerobium sp.]|uniref:glycosyltransferase n=1 Tax=Halanaerobium sp. TaxID=1895664 RepID=UPI000DE78C8A
MLLTIGMMVKNEGKHLEECLEALSLIREALDSELIIIDTGSDDNTVEIAKKFTENVYFHEWNEHFSEMRNKVISYSKGDWYFSLDGDEIVSNPETIINFFKSGKYKKYKTAFVTQKNYTDEKNENFTKILVPRLFENDEDFHFEGAVHNQPQFKKPIYGLSTVLDHYGYISSDKELMEKKFQRTATILKRELEKDPENIYYWYQLSRSYAMHGDNGEALDAILKAYNIMKDKKHG